MFSPRLTWRVGFDGQLGRDTAFYNLPISPEDGFTRLYGQTVPRFQQGSFPLDRAGAALFTDATWDVGGGVRLIPGLRADTFRYVGQNRLTFDPRLVVRWKTSPAQTWKAGAGIFHQMPAAAAAQSAVRQPQPAAHPRGAVLRRLRAAAHPDG